ncbi:PAS domain-containing sensor histidine kinase [Roseobacter weihaiensis]|uniref:PAS domain-containing sensor histidine kinase n=1 Tax=Roseobacter weihaiensis TaxID=2763262 RepID=UPI001D0BB73F|nr:PAS domain-containing sensor histidine kinase [Roseobacter sp. H9]
MSPLQDLPNKIGIALLVVGEDGKIIFSNRATTRIFGLSTTAFCKMNICDLLPDWALDGDNSQALSEGSEQVIRPLYGVHSSGRSLALEARIMPESMAEDGFRYTMALRDVADELEAERLAKAEHRRMEYAISGAKVGIFEVDLLTGSSQTSGAWREIMGVPPDAEIDTQAEWRSRVHPEDLPRVEFADQECICGRTERSLTEYRVRRSDGSDWSWMRSDAIADARDKNGMATKLIGVQTEITRQKTAEDALRRSEHQFRTALENAPIGQALVATDGRWLAVNPAMCRFLGYSEEELLNIDFQTVTHPADLEPDIEQVQRLLDGKEMTYSIDKRYLRRDGEIVWGNLSVALVRDANGAPLHFISQILDISERRRLERMEREFVATVSHELRTPVTSISSALALIDPASFEALPAKIQKLISITHENSDRLRKLLDDILDFEKLASDKMSLTAMQVDAMQMAKRSIEAVRPMAEQFGIVTSLDDPERFVPCKADPNRLQQILANLLSNAIKFSHKGGHVRVDVTTNASHVRIAVVDQGIGVPAAFRETIFQPFIQVAPSSTRQRTGTGLGLSITKQLVEQMGGTIGLCAEQPEGSEFWVKLPLAD